MRIFIVLFLIIVFSVPWYFPEGAIRPFILGMPVWAFVSFIFSILLSIVTSYIILKSWKDEEEK